MMRSVTATATATATTTPTAPTTPTTTTTTAYRVVDVAEGATTPTTTPTTPTPTPTTHVGDGLQAVVVGSGGDDLGVVLARGVEVMVVGVEARVLELHRLANGWVNGWMRG